jgi:hypothetical protein
MAQGEGVHVGAAGDEVVSRTYISTYNSKKKSVYACPVSAIQTFGHR